ncbi:MAG: T9SS type A sorting domain-containing protein [Bacteroidia bacterium]|nr:T9SS type A sorting domain-containing protein [Bacteroidia bacterium]
MKKIYLSLFTIALAFTASAQLALTKAFNEPVVGNVNTQMGYDSTTAIPKNIGTGQSWNFTSLVTNTVVEVATYTTVVSTPSGSAFPGATIAEGDGAGAFNYWKSTTTNFELLGNDDGAGSLITFTNSAIAAIFPINYGNSLNDTYGGPVSVASTAGVANGTISTNATGTGTVILPGSLSFANCLQVKMTNTLNVVVGTFPSSFTLDVISTDYNYYSGTQKFPLLTISYQKQTANSILGPTVQVTADIRINNAVLTGITDVTLDAVNYNVYPNPATDAVNVNLTNDKNEPVSLSVMNNLGQVVKSVVIGNVSDVNYHLSTFDLKSGIYYIKTSVGDKSTTKKLIIQ